MDIIASSGDLCPFASMSDIENRSLPDKFMLRMPAGLRDRIKASAAKNKRSMNAEILSNLESAYPEASDTLWMRVDDLRRAIDEYERETDPKHRMYLQLVVEGLASGVVSIEDDDLQG